MGPRVASVEVVLAGKHQRVLEVVQGLHPVGDGDLVAGPLHQRVGGGDDEPVGAVLQLSGNVNLLGEVEHLEVIDELVDGADLFPARVPDVPVGLSALLQLADGHAGGLNQQPLPLLKDGLTFRPPEGQSKSAAEHTSPTDRKILNMKDGWSRLGIPASRREVRG